MNTVVGLLIGASLGAFVGWRGRCASGSCPLTSNPFLGGLCGALMGMLVAGLLSGSAGQMLPNSSEGSRANMTTKEMSNVIDLESEQSFDQTVLQSPVPVIVDFWAPWCGPCRKQSPIVDQLADQEADRLRVVKVNVDAHEALARRFDIRGIPTLIVFSNGKEKTRLIGLHSLEQVKNAVGA